MSSTKEHANVADMITGLKNLPAVLQQMGWKALREGQDEVVRTIMAGRNTVCILPTGLGKTACFTVPTLAMGWRTVVFSPLIALMDDQVRGMQAAGIRAAAIHSGQPAAVLSDAMNAWVSGDLQVMLVAPERVENEAWTAVMDMVPPDFVVLDEAHTLSAWADSFRASYKKAGDYVSTLAPKVIAAFSATMNRDIEAEVRDVLHIEDATRILHYPRRANLKLDAQYIPAGNQPDTYVADWVYDNCKGSTIVYCSTVERTGIMTQLLNTRLDGEVVCYNGKMPAHDKRRSMERFMSGDARIICATNAFGMGVDKADVRNVVHRDIPGTMEAMAQEAGRAGRDGLASYCTAFLSDDSIRTQEFFLRTGFPTEDNIRAVFAELLKLSENMVVKAKLNIIAKDAGVDPFGMTAIMEFMRGVNIVERRVAEYNPGYIKYNVVASMPGNMLRLRDAIYMLGVEASDNKEYIEFDVEQVAAYLNVTKYTTHKNLVSTHTSGFADYIAPVTGKPLNLLMTDLSTVNFDRLNAKAAAARGKLQSIVTYFEVEDKHTYMEEHLLSAEDLKAIRKKRSADEATT